MKTIKYFLLFIVIALLSSTSSALASGQRLVHGAGTIPSGSIALSLDLGLDLPEPFLYGVRLDFGVGDRVQLGVGTTAIGVINLVGIYSTFNVFKSENESDFISLYLIPSLIHVTGSLFEEDAGGSGNVVLFFVKPGIAYEHRFGDERRTGLYFKAGTIHFLAGTDGGNFAWGSFGTDTMAISMFPGFQHNFSERFSLAVEAGVYLSLKGHTVIHITSSGMTQEKTMGVVPAGKISFSFVF